MTFRIYGPGADCSRPAFVNTVAAPGNGVIRSDPFLTRRPGRYTFVASYSGDASNEAAAEPCGAASPSVQVVKRQPDVRPKAKRIGRKRIAIRARISRALSPSGVIRFQLRRRAEDPGALRTSGRVCAAWRR